MKRLIYLWAAVAALTSAGVFGGCHSDDEPLPPYRLYNERDSAVCSQIVHDYKSVLLGPRIVADSLPTWHFASWKWSETEKQYRLVGLRLTGCAYTPSENPPYYISNLDSLVEFRISGRVFMGPLPESICKLTRLTDITIHGTEITSLPDGLFNEHTRFVKIANNKQLTKLPASVTRLRSKADETRSFVIINNGFKGECPPIVDAVVRLENNKFTSMDWNSFFGKFIGRDNTGDVYGGPVLNYNHISGTPPPDIMSKLMADTLAYYRARTTTSHQEGDGIDWPHSDAEFYRILNEYRKSHPL